MRILLHTLLAAFYCCLAISSLPTQAQEIWNGEIDKNLQGTGSVSDPFLIKTANQLAGLAKRVNAGEDFKDKHIRLDADLFMSDASKPSAEKKQWTPISGIFYKQLGAWEWSSDTLYFRGHFDGAGHTIHNLYYNQVPDFGKVDINDPTSDIRLDFSGWNKGLFGYVDGGSISNLKLENDTIIGAVAIGGIVAINRGGTISHCSVTGFVGSVESGPCGAIVGLNNGGIVEFCAANATSKGTRAAGVLVGSNIGAKAIIRDSHAEGKCHVTQYRAGGFCGEQVDDALIERCWANVEVTNSAYKYASFDCAGFVSNNDGIIRECYATGNVTSPKSAAGFVACNVGRIESCYCTGNVTVGGWGCTASAFVGENGVGSSNWGEILNDNPGVTINCFGTGKCTGSDDQASLTGFLSTYWNESPNSSRTLFCSYNSTNNPIADVNLRTKGGSIPKTTQQMQSQEFVDTLNMVAAWMGTSTWTYRPGNYPIPTGVKSNDLTNYIGGGDGTKEHPYLINTKEHLLSFAQLSNLGWDFRGQYIQQTANIDLNLPQAQWNEEMPTEWIPIGQGANRNNMGEDNGNAFTFRGCYDGDYHEVRNMYINSHYDDMGFFGVLNHGATIKNLGVTNVWAKTVKGNIGILAGSSARRSRNVNIAQCWTSGQVESTEWAAGGILGQIALEGNTNILNCASSAHIKGQAYASAIVGDQNYIGGEAWSNDTIANFIFTGTFEKEECFVPLREYERLFNTYFDANVYAYSTNPDQVNIFGGRTTTYLQSKELANIFNYWVDQWNATHPLQLNYFNHKEGKYLATEEGFTPPYKVSFNSEGGSPVIAQSILEDSKIAAPVAPQLDNKVFAGWYTDAAHTQVFNFDNNLSNNITLHAKWLDTFSYDLKPFQNPFATSYVIKTKEQLLGLSIMTRGIEGVQEATDFTGKTVKLGADIALNDTTDWKYWGKCIQAVPWPSVGQTYTHTFNGTFDGQGHTISGLYQLCDNTTDLGNYEGIQQGLFGYLGAEAKVSNVYITASAVLRTADCDNSNTYGYVGLLAGKNKGLVDNCHVEGFVETKNLSDIGALIGHNLGFVSNCSSKGSVTSHENRHGMSTGGLIGYSEMPTDTDTLRNCHALVTVQGFANVGGLVGKSTRGVLLNCYATGNVTSNNNEGWACGGLAGEASNLIQCYAQGDVNAPQATNVGGLVGKAFNLKQCYATGNVVGKENVGGLTGGAINYEINADSCYAKGNVSGLKNVGGLTGIGRKHTQCYATGNVSGQQYVGGLVGGNGNEITNCYAQGNVQYAGESAANNEVYVGGLVGIGFDLKNSHATGNVIAPHGKYVGGLAGKGSAKSCYATGDVEGGDCVGGLVGQHIDDIELAYATGNVKGNNEVGGLIGSATKSFWDSMKAVTRCTASGNVVATGNCVGGLVGNSCGVNLTESYAEGSVWGNNNVGGLVGQLDVTTTHCYARGNVTGTGSAVAGLVGGKAWSYVRSSYATGKVVGAEADIAGLRCNGYPTPDNAGNYFDKETSGLSDDALDTPCSTEEMKRITTFTGWDFENLWGRRADINEGYPYLRWTIKENLPNDLDVPSGISNLLNNPRQQKVRKLLKNGKIIIVTPEGHHFGVDGKHIK